MADETFVNPKLQAMRDFWNSLPQGLLTRDHLDDLILHQLELSSEAERQYHLAEHTGGLHFMQTSALSEIIAWVERAVKELSLRELEVKHSGRHSLTYVNGNSTPALCFGWMFSSLSGWLNNEKLNSEQLAEAPAT